MTVHMKLIFAVFTTEFDPFLAGGAGQFYQTLTMKAR